MYELLQEQIAREVRVQKKLSASSLIRNRKTFGSVVKFLVIGDGQC